MARTWNLLFVFAFVCFVSCARKCHLSSECPGSASCDMFTHHWDCVQNSCQCSNGNKPITSENYTLYFDNKNFDQAVSICKSKGQRLVRVDDVDTFNKLKDFAYKYMKDAYPNPSTPDGIWMGMKLDSIQKPGIVYRHLDGTRASFFMWETDTHEPNVIDGENCIRIDATHFLMRTTDCSHGHPYICENVASSNPHPSQGRERCVTKWDCGDHCKTSEYHCMEYACMCGKITFGDGSK